ncbi:hypothetical protein ASF26_21285 [Methylobacterium sp. Leaf93]|nr:hypothetical protein ASF26_21285 [Methylobacterium sp. Leaf93]
MRQEMRYEDWIERFDDKPETDRETFERKLQTLRTRPMFSIVMPAYETPAELLEAAISSVRGQIYTNWELCICDDGSSGLHIIDILERISREEPRLRWTRLPTNMNISAASNAAFALATGDWIVPFDHDDLLRPHALLEVALAISNATTARFVYSDEDKIDTLGLKRFEPHFKPDWSPDLLRSFNYLNHLSAMRSDDVRAIGGWTLGLEGVQDHDLYLKVTEVLRRDEIVHIPKILYHWRVLGSGLNQHQKAMTAASATAEA